MSIVSKTGNYASAANLLAQQYARAASKPRAFEDAALESIALNDPARADALKKQLDEARQAVAQIGNAKQDVNQSRKAAAAERVKQIKAQIQALRMMGGDPKSIARQVAQLAREMSAAASEYASAGGGAQQASQPMADGATATAGGNVETAEAAESGSVATTVKTEVSSATNREQAEPGRKTDQSEDATVSAALSGVTLAEGSRQYQENQKQQFKDAVQNSIAELQQKSSAAAADKAFAQEVRALAEQLKALAKQQEQRLRQARDQSASGDLSQANQALAEAESSASKISVSVIAVSPSINIAV